MRRDVTNSARWKGVDGERRDDVTDGARGKVAVWRDVMLQTMQDCKGPVRRDVMLQTVHGVKRSVGRYVLLQSVQEESGLSGET